MKIKTIFATQILTMASMASAQTFESEYISEWQWNCNDKVNWVNLLRLDFGIETWNNGSLDAATLHTAKTHETIIEDYQTFSNIEDDYIFLAFALLGYTHSIGETADITLGIRNMNEDFFTSEITSFFTSSSPGIFPTISATYPIANYPVASLNIHAEIRLSNFTIKESFYNGVGYNGFKKNDNPFIFRPKTDGIFNVTQVSYATNGGTDIYAGAAVHTKEFNDELQLVGTKTSAAWWIYAEHVVMERENAKLAAMAQYSENTNKNSGCRRYAEIGATAEVGTNTFGLSAQFAQFQPSNEFSLEASYHKQLTDNLSMQPTFMYVKNDSGNNAIVSMRLIYDF